MRECLALNPSIFVHPLNESGDIVLHLSVSRFVEKVLSAQYLKIVCWRVANHGSVVTPREYMFPTVAQVT